MHEEIKNCGADNLPAHSPVPVGAADPGGPSPVSHPARKINQSAINRWLDEEWKKQLWNAEHAVSAFDISNAVRSGEISAVCKSDYDLISDTVAKLNGLIAPYTAKRADAEDYVTPVANVRAAYSLIDSLDETEKAAYDRRSMEIMVRSGRTNCLQMLCFAVTTHFWQLCKVNSYYPNWIIPYFRWSRVDKGNDLDRLKEHVRNEIVSIAEYAAKSPVLTLPGSEIALPAEFCE